MLARRPAPGARQVFFTETVCALVAAFDGKAQYFVEFRERFAGEPRFFKGREFAAGAGAPRVNLLLTGGEDAALLENANDPFEGGLVTAEGPHGGGQTAVPVFFKAQEEGQGDLPVEEVLPRSLAEGLAGVEVQEVVYHLEGEAQGKAEVFEPLEYCAACARFGGSCGQGHGEEKGGLAAYGPQVLAAAGERLFAAEYGVKALTLRALGEFAAHHEAHHAR